ncbi:hypothetical protein EHQ76_09150 [Leptospira barantonii]|uniref:Uncharacterized protein n=1 Tax=Leptospira barantonii TaxID=2023184 RepID=A0A5F2BDZ4_9LEPT|nr:hypothetical protein EHQ76_09150 [Leptospira barantonii]
MLYIIFKNYIYRVIGIRILIGNSVFGKLTSPNCGFSRRFEIASQLSLGLRHICFVTRLARRSLRLTQVSCQSFRAFSALQDRKRREAYFVRRHKLRLFCNCKIL